MTAVVWGGTDITLLRVGLAAVAEVLLIAYFVWMARSVGR
jgi:hypothetical protein